MVNNILKNGGFESDWDEECSHQVKVFPDDGEPYVTELGEFHTPPGWVSWYRHDPGVWDQPEVGDIRKEHVLYRIQDGEKAARLFTFYRRHDAGFMQQVAVDPGCTLRLSGWAHGWSNHPLVGHEDCADDPHCSCGVGRGPICLMEEEVPDLNGEPWNDAVGNMAFMLGIDPTGGTDPFADAVAWGPVAHIYNGYHQVPEVEAVSEAETVTVFLRSRTQWAFKHNDAYWDNIELVVVAEPSEPEPPDPEPEPKPDPDTAWDYPVIARGSKIGVHAIYANQVRGFAEALAADGAQFPVVKAVDDLGWLPGIRAILPEVITIGRYTSRLEGCGGVEDPDCDIDAMADALLEVIKSRADVIALESVDYWEVVNEPDPPGPEGYERLAALMIACMEKAETEGWRLALFGLNAGTPEWDEMQAMVRTGVFGRAKEGGHILTLHEGTFTSHDPRQWWGDAIPGSPEVEGAGALNFRYRYLYHLLEERREVVPLVVSEWYCGDEQSASTETIVDALTWYDDEASRDYYVWATCPFTLGPTSGWRHSDYERVYPALIRRMVDLKNRENALPPGEEPEEPEEPVSTDCVPPRVPYRRSYVLLPQMTDPVQRREWRVAAAIGSAERMETVGHSADDAGVGPPIRRITVVNPSEQGNDLRSWYEEHYPGALYREIEERTPWEVALRLLPALEGDIALGQNDPRWEAYECAQHPGVATMGVAGGLLTAFTIMLRKVYGCTITPPYLDRLLTCSRSAFVSDCTLPWGDAISLLSAFDDHIADDKQRTVEELAALQENGWEIILRQVTAEGGEREDFVYLERIVDDALHVIDVQSGYRKRVADKDELARLQGIRAAHLRHMPSVPTYEQLAGAVEPEACLPPREPYARTYVLLSQIEEPVERLEWRLAAAIGSSDARRTFGHSADDAGTGPPERCVIAVNPRVWGDDLEAWYGEHYPEACYQALEAETPWDMAIEILPALEEDIALAQTDARWAEYDFRESSARRDGSGEDIVRYGCFLTGASVILRQIYRRAVTPPMLDGLLVAARWAYVKDNLSAWKDFVALFSVFDEAITDSQPRTASDLKRLLDDGWQILLRTRADGGHFVYLEDIDQNSSRLQVIDTFDGERKEKHAENYDGICAAHVREGFGPPIANVLIGMHDEPGGEWMADQGMAGCCLVHAQVQRRAAQLDFRHLQEADIVVIGRLNWGYADGTGTFPRPDCRDAFVDAVVETMLAARGVDYFHVGNEPNNRQEWPGFGSGNVFALTREYVTEIYNDVWRRVDGQVRMGPPPIDPYFGPGSDNRDWFIYLLEHVDGADAIFLHSKTQTNDPDEVWSRARFSHWPLEWQYLHLRTVETGLSLVPDRFQELPVFVTELNPQHLDAHGRLGWRRGNALWVRQALRYFREVQPVAGVVFYRYDVAGDQAPFGLCERPVILDAIAEESKKTPATHRGHFPPVE